MENMKNTKGGGKMRAKMMYKNPAILDRQVEILYELGLPVDEINYLIYLKLKKQASAKWL